MRKCGDKCIPCCDYCIHVLYETIEFGSEKVNTEPIGCVLHNDEEHQEIAKHISYCDDFYCTRRFLEDLDISKIDFPEGWWKNEILD